MTESTRPVTVLSTRRRVIRGDVSLIVGQSWKANLQYVVLLAAATIDVVAFHLVLVDAIDEYEAVIWGFVVGFTLVCLGLSHFAGQSLKNASVLRDSPQARLFAFACFGVWGFLGLIAFLFRWIYDRPKLDGGTTFEEEGQASLPQAVDEAAASRLMTALLFLALYLATGLLSAFMSFKTHNPAAQQYARVVAKRSKAAAKLAVLHAKLIAAQELKQRVLDLRGRVEKDQIVAQDLPGYSVKKLLADTRFRSLGSAHTPPADPPPGPQSGKDKE